MGQKWYQKTTIQASIIGGMFILIAATLPLICNRGENLIKKKEQMISPVASKNNRVHFLDRNSVSSDSINSMDENGLRKLLRANHKVRELEPAESGFKLSKAPRGVYGYVNQVDICFPDIVEAELSRRPYFTEFEVHKLLDGSLFVIGFIGAEIATQLRIEQSFPTGHFTFYSNKWSNAPEIVALQLSKVKFLEGPRRIEFDNGFGPAALDIVLK